MGGYDGVVEGELIPTDELLALEARRLVQVARRLVGAGHVSIRLDACERPLEAEEGFAGLIIAIRHYWECTDVSSP